MQENPPIELCSPPGAERRWQKVRVSRLECRLGEPVPRLGEARTLDKAGTWSLDSLGPLAFALPWILAWATQPAWDMESSSPRRTLPDRCYTCPPLQGKFQAQGPTRATQGLQRLFQGSWDFPLTSDFPNTFSALPGQREGPQE